MKKTKKIFIITLLIITIPIIVFIAFVKLMTRPYPIDESKIIKIIKVVDLELNGELEIIKNKVSVSFHGEGGNVSIALSNEQYNDLINQIRNMKNYHRNIVEIEELYEIYKDRGYMVREFKDINYYNLIFNEQYDLKTYEDDKIFVEFDSYVIIASLMKNEKKFGSIRINISINKEDSTLSLSYHY